MAFEVSSVPLSLTMVLGLPRSTREAIEFARHPEAGDRGIGDQRQALARAVVNHDQDAHAAAVDELIGDEVERKRCFIPILQRRR
jgi:hypothetical protein